MKLDNPMCIVMADVQMSHLGLENGDSHGTNGGSLVGMVGGSPHEWTDVMDKHVAENR